MNAVLMVLLVVAVMVVVALVGMYRKAKTALNTSKQVPEEVLTKVKEAAGFEQYFVVVSYRDTAEGKDNALKNYWFQKGYPPEDFEIALDAIKQDHRQKNVVASQ